VVLRRWRGEEERAWGSGGREKSEGANGEAEENVPDCDRLIGNKGRVRGKLECLDV
jgi:hypothetical protein